MAETKTKPTDASIDAYLQETRLRDLAHLKVLGVSVGWATPYVLLDDRRSPSSSA